MEQSIRQHIGRADAVKEARQYTRLLQGFHMPEEHALAPAKQTYNKMPNFLTAIRDFK